MNADHCQAGWGARWLVPSLPMIGDSARRMERARRVLSEPHDVAAMRSILHPDGSGQFFLENRTAHV